MAQSAGRMLLRLFFWHSTSREVVKAEPLQSRRSGQPERDWRGEGGTKNAR